MAQIVTITNPLTGQPAQVDQLEHTAQQIDDAIARALPGGDIDITLQNKAPAGYGYGEAQAIAFWDDDDGTKLEQGLDSKFAPGSMRGKVFRTMLVDYPICKVSGNGGFADIFADESNDSNGYSNSIIIVFYARNIDKTGPSIATKQKIGGTWYPWEYVNPPMLLGVEYRTTERWDGKPVYAMVLDFGPLPNNTDFSTDIPGWVSTNRAFSVNVIAHGGGETVPVPVGLSSDYSSSYWYINNNDKRLYIRSRVDLSGYTSCYVYIKYTKA